MSRMRALVYSALLLSTTAWLLQSSDNLFETASEKVDQIATDRAPRGTTITLSKDEVNALVRGKIREKKIEGVRDPKVELGDGQGSWSGLVEFAKLKQLEGLRNSFLFSSVLQGEKPVTAALRLASANGKATIDVEHVTIGETRFEGSVLAFVVQSLILDDFPNAKIGEPFDLEHNVEQIRIQPAAISIKIRN